MFFFLLPMITWAQNQIAGKIVRADTKTPLAGASIFLSNSSFGTTAANDGTFSLNDVKPGQYNLVVSAVGYDDYNKTLLVNNDPIKLTIELSPKAIQLKEVSISAISKADLKTALEQFKTEFIGSDTYAKDCKIINPDVLNFAFHQNKNILEAYTDSFLIIENDALGYRIKFLLNDFKSDKLAGTISYKGQRFFEELPGSSSQKKKWTKNRDDAYYGSAMHFYRSLYKNTLDSEGFKVYRLTRELNPIRPSEEMIQQNLTKFRKGNSDSLLNWTNISQLPLYTRQKLSKDPYKVSDILKKADQKGMFSISSPDYIYIIYTKKWEEEYFRDTYHAPNMLNYATTVVSFANKDHIAFFDNNGIITGNSPLYEGSWSKSRLSEKLPVDYIPVNKPPEIQ